MNRIHNLINPQGEIFILAAVKHSLESGHTNAQNDG